MLDKLVKAACFAAFACIVFGFVWVEWKISSAPPPRQQAIDYSYKPAKGSTPEIAVPKLADDRVADYTWWVAAFTFALVIVSAFQGFFLIRADKTARIAANAARDSADAALGQSNVADKQLSILSLQTDIQKKQHAIGRLQFIAENRPRLKIRSITIIRQKDLPRQLFKEGSKIKGHLVVVNTGETAATIIESFYRFYWNSMRSGLPMDPPLGEKTLPLFNVPDPLEGKASILLPIESVDPIDFAPDRLGPYANARKLYLMGWIRYADVEDKERFMAFCREYVPGMAREEAEGHFLAVDNPDYEYED